MQKAEFNNFLYVDENYLKDVFKKDIISIFDYSDFFARELLFQYKFEGKRELGKFFAGILDSYISADETAVPVPSSVISIKQRGWDQMKLICKHLRRKYALMLMNNSSFQQKKLSKEERLKSGLDRFSINKSSVVSRESKIVVIDDVYTTGNTVLSAMNLLKSDGYENVRAITLYAEI